MGLDIFYANNARKGEALLLIIRTSVKLFNSTFVDKFNAKIVMVSTGSPST